MRGMIRFKTLEQQITLLVRTELGGMKDGKACRFDDAKCKDMSVLGNAFARAEELSSVLKPKLVKSNKSQVALVFDDDDELALTIAYRIYTLASNCELFDPNSTITDAKRKRTEVIFLRSCLPFYINTTCGHIHFDVFFCWGCADGKDAVFCSVSE
jgi:hypothetical protein